MDGLQKILDEHDVQIMVWHFAGVLREPGRATVGICVTATILERAARLEYETVQWAREVLKLWTNRPTDTNCVCIKDELHPTRIEEYAGNFIKLTTEEA